MQIILRKIAWIVDVVTIPPPKYRLFIGYCKRKGGPGRLCITPDWRKLCLNQILSYFFLFEMYSAAFLTLLPFLILFHILLAIFHMFK